MNKSSQVNLELICREHDGQIMRGEGHWFRELIGTDYILSPDNHKQQRVLEICSKHCIRERRISFYMNVNQTHLKWICICYILGSILFKLLCFSCKYSWIFISKMLKGVVSCYSYSMFANFYTIFIIIFGAKYLCIRPGNRSLVCLHMSWDMSVLGQCRLKSEAYYLQVSLAFTVKSNDDVC